MQPAASKLRLAAGLLAVLTFLALVSASRMVVGTAAAGRPMSWSDALGSAALDWYLWAPLLPAVLLLARRFPFEQGAVGRALAVHVPAALAASLLQITAFAAASALVRELRFGEGAFERELRSGFLFKFHTGVVVYGAFVLGVQALALVRRAREESLRRAELDRRLSETRLQVLQAHLRPHFLFNTLNTISATLRDDPDGAERMLVRLGDLLRTALQHRDDHELTLREELEFLEAYLEIQRVRFGERLGVELEVDPTALDARVPSFVLQPLVENAIRHGVAAEPGPRRVRVDVAHRNGRVELSVSDDGPGPAADAAEREARGLGLSSTRERLRLLYGNDFEFGIGPGATGGTRLRLAVPYRPGSLHRGEA